LIREVQAEYSSPDLYIEFVADERHSEIMNIDLYKVTIAGVTFDPWELPTKLTDELLRIGEDLEYYSA